MDVLGGIVMGFNDYMVEDSFEYEDTCPECGKKFKCLEIEQMPGFRDRYEKICPHCHCVIRSSMEYEYFTFKIAENGKRA